ncbi:hypothetical protein LXL04_020628 [Taraxacum kok-saghyz]
MCCDTYMKFPPSDVSADRFGVSLSGISLFSLSGISLPPSLSTAHLEPPPATTVAAGDHRAAAAGVAGKSNRDSKSKSVNGVLFISTPRSKPLN